LTIDDTIAELKIARDGFLFSLGAYALLTKEPASSELSRYGIKVCEDGNIVVSENEQSHHRGTSYTICFNDGLSESAAKSVVDASFKKMIIDSNHVIQKHKKENNINISEPTAFRFIRHYRNAIAHNGRWSLHSAKDLPITWRNRTLTFDMNNQSIDGFLTWFEGLQLCAQLILYLDQSK